MSTSSFAATLASLSHQQQQQQLKEQKERDLQTNPIYLRTAAQLDPYASSAPSDPYEASLDGQLSVEEIKKRDEEAAARAEQDPELIMLALRGLPEFPDPIKHINVGESYSYASIFITQTETTTEKEGEERIRRKRSGRRAKDAVRLIFSYANI